jgi:endonuclease G
MREEIVANYLTSLMGRGHSEALRPRKQTASTESATNPVLAAANAGIEAIEKGRVPSPEQSAGIEAIILPKIRPVLDVVDGDFRTGHPLWLKLNEDQAIRSKLRLAIPSIGRIELPGNSDYPYAGTGFIVGAGLVMTNRHVAEIFASGEGTRSVTFRPGHKAGIDFLQEIDRGPGPLFRVKRVVMIHPYWDMALLSVEGIEGVSPLTLSDRDIAESGMIEVAAIGYPAFDSRNPTDVQNDLFRKVFGVKRLQPGTLGGRVQTDSFGKVVAASVHNCTTLGGNSGSSLIALDDGSVVALHFGGRYSKANYGVPSCELAKDPRVVDAGVLFQGNKPSSAPAWDAWWRRADNNTNIGEASDTPQPPHSSTTTNTAVPAGSVAFTVPLTITVSLGGSVGTVTDAGVLVEGGDGITEKLAEPFHDSDYSSRTGYDSAFLDVEVPPPVAADPAVVAKAKNGDSVLHYQNFSIVMHAKRRLALITASNVTAEPKLKKPDSSKLYSRKGLSGLGKNDQEKWFADPRLDDAFQLPDVFYTRDDAAFDKGHLVRREDVAWGTTYKSLRRANGDTYHVTNCSPQVAHFNRSNLGDDNWGDLENHVLKSASKERYCQFSGPVLDPADEVFVGSLGGRVKVRVKIPSSFWKVIVVATTEGPASYGFLLEQELTDVPLEFSVPDEFRRFLVPLAEIQTKAGIKFPEIVINADRHDTDEGEELALRAGIKHRASSDSAARGTNG